MQDDAVKALLDEYKWLQDRWEIHFEDAQQANAEGDVAAEKSAMGQANLYIAQINTLNAAFFFKHGKWTRDGWVAAHGECGAKEGK